MLIAYPPHTRVGKVLPKSKIYEHARISAALKRKFIDQVKRITWSYKLSPETLRLPATKSVPEIEIFTIDLDSTDISVEVIRTIDRSIPYPIFYELVHGDRTRVVAAFKRPSDADSSKWVTQDYFESEWLPLASERIPLFSSIDLGRLYEQMLIGLVPITRRPSEPFMAFIERANAMRSFEREAGQLQSKLEKEKQFNRKVELNAELRKLWQEIEELS